MDHISSQYDFIGGGNLHDRSWFNLTGIKSEVEYQPFGRLIWTGWYSDRISVGKEESHLRITVPVDFLH